MVAGEVTDERSERVRPRGFVDYWDPRSLFACGRRVDRETERGGKGKREMVVVRERGWRMSGRAVAGRN